MIPSIIVAMESNAEPPVEYVNDYYAPLQSTNTYYDPLNPDELVNQGISIRQESHRQITIRITGATSDDRNSIQNQVESLLFAAKHYQYNACLNYDPLTSECSTTEGECDALTSDNRFAVVGKCPFLDVIDVTDSDYRNPLSVFTLSGIAPNSLRIKPEKPDTLLNISKEIYTSDFFVEFDDVVVYNVSANPVCVFSGYENFTSD
jgi:hypothetical protein